MLIYENLIEHKEMILKKISTYVNLEDTYIQIYYF